MSSPKTYFPRSFSFAPQTWLRSPPSLRCTCCGSSRRAGNPNAVVFGSMTSSVGAHSWVGFTTSSRNSAWMTAGSRRIFSWLGPCLMTCWPGLVPGSTVRTPSTGAPYELRRACPPSLCQWRQVKLNADWLLRLSVTRRSVKSYILWTLRVCALGALFRCGKRV